MSDYDAERRENNISPTSQLGTNPTILANNEYDMRLLSYIPSSEKIHKGFRPLLFFLVQRDVVNNKKDYLDALIDNYLTLINSLDGRGQNNQVRAENAQKGLSVPIEQAPTTPSLLQRLTGADEVREYENYKERKEAGLV